MQQYRDVVTTPLGRAIQGATITVTLAGGGTPTLYSDNGTTALGSNVLTSNAQGEYSFYAASNRYTLSIAASGYTTTTRDVVLWDPADLASTASGFGSKLVAFIKRATGAVARWVEDKLAERVSVFDFMTEAQIAAVQAYTATEEHTALWEKANKNSLHFHVPAGKWNLKNWRPLSGTKITTDGRGVTDGGSALAGVFIHQFATGDPAIKVLANADQYTDKNGDLQYYGQLKGLRLTGFTTVGKASATVPAVTVECQGVFAVWDSVFDFCSLDTYSPFSVLATDANGFFRNTVRITSEGVHSLGGQTGTCSIQGGAYCDIDVFITNCANATAFSHSVTNSKVVAVTDAGQVHAGYLNDIWATIENWYGAASTQAIQNSGTSNRLRICSLISIPRGKANIGVLLNSTPSTLEGINIGSPAVSLPMSARPGATSATLTSNWATDVTGAYPVYFSKALTFTGALTDATSATLTANWASATGVADVTFSDGSVRQAYFTSGSTAVVWVGGVTATASITVSIRRVAVLTSGANTCTWVGDVDTSITTATVEHFGPQYPISMPYGSSGTITDAVVGGCQYRLEEYVPASILSGFQFVGDCRTLVRKGGIFADAGAQTFAAATTATVVLNRLQPDNAYRVTLTPSANKTFWVTDKTEKGFTLNASASSSDAVDWAVAR